MTKEKLKSTIFIVIFCITVLGASPYMIKNHILKNNDSSKENEEYVIDGEEELDDIFKDDDEQLEENNSNENQTSNEVSNITSNIVSNKTSNVTSNAVSNTVSNKPVTSNSSSGKNNKVKNPGMTYDGFTVVDKTYFNDALFIGDSRTVGLRDYGNLKNASYFCDVGMSSFNIDGKKLSVKGVGTVSIDQLLAKKKYSKIYVMLGINEVGYDLNTAANKYLSLIKKIKAKQPEAIIYIQANLHVSKGRNDRDKYVNNDRLNRLNGLMSKIADNNQTFYIDINEYFDDANGNLKAAYTSDGTHPYAKYYAEWTNWIMKHAVVR